MTTIRRRLPVRIMYESLGDKRLEAERRQKEEQEQLGDPEGGRSAGAKAC
jgi:hypothetical protein